jgi:hypothetical protein
MYLLFAEMLLALSIIVFIMWWTLKGADTSHQHQHQHQSMQPQTKIDATVDITDASQSTTLLE